ncbi:hypothetical protein GUITHDRAFT_114885 [Guillardia theta CCMP2712]|uniref:J domain-containing protein n=1 Tax=Guillardia theta (strain CCMP2712) TaxID=905079 RepID=L1ISX3_GUITC|nr:hypothetical protein GUITHDRAFT_114885 [Guillardia theta CCMP2712]EKX39004.1 hypothetical protein GUITHDRAFT_114885 [Guillardia theta CCMP2712]|eukprot:XP_005825984.1 hypothetical protein GUITHDRAFT_114885 [Guillardia theta CCMP2712]
MPSLVHVRIAAILLVVTTFLVKVVDGRAKDRFPEGMNIYCKTKSCYDVLELEQDCTSADIKKAYRRQGAGLEMLSLQFHPDKSDEPNAQERFIEIGSAYEVLKNEDVRKAYDDFLAHPERHLWEHYSNYYQAYYAPKSDVRLVILGILLLLSILQYSIAYSRRSRLIQMILSQSKTQAFVKNRMQELGSGSLNLKKPKDHAKFKEIEKKAEMEVLERTAVNGIKLSEPVTYFDVLVVRIIVLPLDIVVHRLMFSVASYDTLQLHSLWFNIRWILMFRILGKEYGAQEHEYITRQILRMREDVWVSLPDEERQEFLELQLWNQEKLEEWQQQQMEADEEKRREFMQSNRYKRVKRFMKKQ